MFNKLKRLKQMRDQALAIQRELAQEQIEVEENGVKVVIAGDQKIRVLEVDGQQDSRVARVVNKAIKKAQEMAARKLREMSGGLGGLLGPR